MMMMIIIIIIIIHNFSVDFLLKWGPAIDWCLNTEGVFHPQIWWLKPHHFPDQKGLFFVVSTPVYPLVI